MAQTKTGGRKKGTPNKVTSELRKDLKSILESDIEEIPTLLEGVASPEKRLNLLIKLLPYVLPKVQSVSQDYGEPFTFDF